ncbi:MAG: rod shape-determining protein [Candidatus Howiella sp.]
MFTKEIVIDLGTANTLVYTKGKGIVMREPSVVAYDVRDDAVKAVGAAAKEMIGRTPGSIVAVRPIKDGVIADFDVTAAMLRHFLRQAEGGAFFSKTNLLVCIPAGVTEVEARAVYDAAKQAGANEVSLIEAPLAAAIGAGLPVNEAAGSMIVTIGAGITDVAILSLGGIVTAQSVRVAGDAFDEAIIAFLRRRHGLLIGERSAEQIKIGIGSVASFEGEQKMEIKGRGTVDGLPKTVTVTAREIRDALTEPVSQITEIIHTTLEKTPPELAADIIERGITITGGSAALRGIDKVIREVIQMPVTIADNPADCAALGAGVRLTTAAEASIYAPRSYRTRI